MLCNQPEIFLFFLFFFKCLVFFTYVEGRHTKIVNGVIDLEVMEGKGRERKQKGEIKFRDLYLRRNRIYGFVSIEFSLRKSKISHGKWYYWKSLNTATFFF